MALRLLELLLPGESLAEVQDFLKEQPIVEAWYDRLPESQTLVKILAPVEETEPLMDLLEKRFANRAGFRLILLPVLASAPRPETPEEVPEKPEEPGTVKAARVSREELYASIADTARLSPVFIVMVFLSALVTAIGLLANNVAVVIGAMVIAPLLGPNISLALATTLGDMSLALNSLKTNAAGIVTALLLSMVLGALLTVNPHTPEIASRTDIGLVAVVLALASGSAGVVAFTTGAPTALIGVMVAVALMPPLVTVGLFIGSQHFSQAGGALLLFLTNIICVNLAAVITFLAQGIRPTTWWEANLAKKATLISIIISASLLAVLILIIIFSKSGHKLLMPE